MGCDKQCISPYQRSRNKKGINCKFSTLIIKQNNENSKQNKKVKSSIWWISKGQAQSRQRQERKKKESTISFRHFNKHIVIKWIWPTTLPTPAISNLSSIPHKEKPKHSLLKIKETKNQTTQTNWSVALKNVQMKHCCIRLKKKGLYQKKQSTHFIPTQIRTIYLQIWKEYNTFPLFGNLNQLRMLLQSERQKKKKKKRLAWNKTWGRNMVHLKTKAKE